MKKILCLIQLIYANFCFFFSNSRWKISLSDHGIHFGKGKVLKWKPVVVVPKEFWSDWNWEYQNRIRMLLFMAPIVAYAWIIIWKSGDY